MLFEFDCEFEKASEGTEGALELTELRFELTGESPKLLTTGGVKVLGGLGALSGEGAREVRLDNWLG